MIVLSADTNLKDYVNTVNSWIKRVQPAERRCLNERMAKRGRTALIKAAKEKANIRKPARYISANVNRRGIRFDLSPGRSGRGRAVNFDRTAQLLQLAATGGTINFRRSRSRLSGVWILKDRRFKVRNALKLIQELRSTGVRRTSGDATIWYGTRGLMLVTRPSGTTLTRRNRGRDSDIIFLPSRANYKKKFDMENVIFRGINQFIEKDAKKCFNDNTLKHFRRGRGV